MAGGSRKCRLQGGDSGGGLQVRRPVGGGYGLLGCRRKKGRRVSSFVGLRWPESVWERRNGRWWLEMDLRLEVGQGLGRRLLAEWRRRTGIALQVSGRRRPATNSDGWEGKAGGGFEGEGGSGAQLRELAGGGLMQVSGWGSREAAEGRPVKRGGWPGCYSVTQGKEAGGIRAGAGVGKEAGARRGLRLEWARAWVGWGGVG